mmetsp:Transcript_45960/g.73625  ORF Transcript_45960/g.73625 Transcript_45960/m.73625 type:complete len:341 (-) Transcript_45960:996-2018(-)
MIDVFKRRDARRQESAITAALAHNGEDWKLFAIGNEANQYFGCLMRRSVHLVVVELDDFVERLQRSHRKLDELGSARNHDLSETDARFADHVRFAVVKLEDQVWQTLFEQLVELLLAQLHAHFACYRVHGQYARIVVVFGLRQNMVRVVQFVVARLRTLFQRLSAQHLIPKRQQFRLLLSQRLLEILKRHRLFAVDIQIREQFVRFLNVESIAEHLHLIHRDLVVVANVDKLKRVLDICRSHRFAKRVEKLPRRRLREFRLHFGFVLVFLALLLLHGLRLLQLHFCEALHQFRRRPRVFANVLIAAVERHIFVLLGLARFVRRLLLCAASTRRTARDLEL